MILSDSIAISIIITSQKKRSPSLVTVLTQSNAPWTGIIHQHNVRLRIVQYKYNSTISEQSLGTASCIVLIWHREQTTIQCRPPPLKLNSDSYVVLEAWHGFQLQLVEPFMKNLVLLFRHEYSVSGHHHAKS